MSASALLIGVALLALNGFFVASEFALLAARRSRLEGLADEGDRRAISAVSGLRELSLMLAGAQLGITMASFGLGAVAEPAVAAGIEVLLEGVDLTPAARHTIAFTLALSMVVFLHMVLGEMAPKSWAISHPERSVLLLARPFRAFALITRPFLRLLNATANAVVRMCGVQPQDERAMVHTPSDLLLLVTRSAEEGQLGEHESGLLSRALDLSGLDAEAVMVPRPDIVAVPADASVAEIEQVASRTGRSRLPVYAGDLDDVLGILHVKDLLQIDPADVDGVTAADLAQPALITPEWGHVEDLMVTMRQRRQHVAIVVDEYGTACGLVTLEDLLEELIGDFEDESDRAGRPLRRRWDGSVLVSGRLRPDELREQTGVDIGEGDFETLAGYVMTCLGRLPRVGDRVSAGQATVRVTRMDGPRVAELAVLAAPPAPAEPST